MDRGYAKLWRKIFDSGWYTKPLTCHLAIHLILKANHKDKKFIFNKKEMVCKRGQLITGRNQLAKETGLSTQNIRTSLDTLSNCGFLTIKSTNKFSIITICNYDSYQDKNIETNQQTNKQVTSKQPATNHKQECKNDKNEKSVGDSPARIKFLDFVLMTKDEHQKLLDRFGQEMTNDYMERLNNHIGSKGRRYKSHYYTICQWIAKDDKNNDIDTTKDDKWSKYD